MHDTDHRDMLGIGQVTTFAPYRDDTGWLVVSPGCEARRKRNGKSVVALSEVEIRLDSEDNRDTCLRHLDESDRRFSQIVSNPWDWQSVRTQGLTVRFAVEWYEREFFTHAAKRSKITTMSPCIQTLARRSPTLRSSTFSLMRWDSGFPSSRKSLAIRTKEGSAEYDAHNWNAGDQRSAVGCLAAGGRVAATGGKGTDLADSYGGRHPGRLLPGPC